MKAPDRQWHGRVGALHIFPDDFIEGEHGRTVEVGEIHFERATAPPGRRLVSRLNIRGGFQVLIGGQVRLSANEAYMGLAAASYWLMGCRPSRSSIVRSIELVV